MIDVVKFMQAKYKLYGRDLATGVDCLGLSICVAAECGIEIPDGKNYTPDTCSSAIREGLDRFKPEKIFRNRLEVRTGDLILLSMKATSDHVGVALDDSQFVTIFNSCGVAILDINTWMKHVENFVRYPGRR